jgi:alpha-glutamyl/putrescinyl thymine pyrophosphorylase clade 1
MKSRRGARSKPELLNPFPNQQSEPEHPLHLGAESLGECVLPDFRSDHERAAQNDDTVPCHSRSSGEQTDFISAPGRRPTENSSPSELRMPAIAPERRQMHAPLIVHLKLAPARPTTVYDTYWRFAAERQAMFFRRLTGEKAPWSADPILQRYKFTNVYRASDRVSQYLIRRVIYAGDLTPREVFFRVVLFKIFNRIDTWERLTAAFGEVRFDTYCFQQYERVLSAAIDHGRPIYSAAYIMPSGSRASGESRKHRMHLRLVEQMMVDRLPERIGGMKRMCDAFELLRSYPTIGDFLAYQYVTDLNYSTITDFEETEFVVPGPGARNGIRKCFQSLGGLTEAEIIRLVADRQEEEFQRLGLKFQSLWGRPMQLVDCQNVFCEVDKYARVFHPDVDGVSARTRIKQRFRPSPEPLAFWYPPKWGINGLVARYAERVAWRKQVDGVGNGEGADLWQAAEVEKEGTCTS